MGVLDRVEDGLFSLYGVGNDDEEDFFEFWGVMFIVFIMSVIIGVKFIVDKGKKKDDEKNE